MPYYTYECMNCGKLTDLVCSISDKEKLQQALICELCGSKHLSQQFKINLMPSNDSESKSCAGDSCGCCNGCN